MGRLTSFGGMEGVEGRDLLDDGIESGPSEDPLAVDAVHGVLEGDLLLHVALVEQPACREGRQDSSIHTVVLLLLCKQIKGK